MSDKRNFNPQTFWDHRGQAHQPRHHWTGGDFASWKQDLLPKVLATLGHLPKPVDPRPQLVVEWCEEGLIKQRWLIDVQENLSTAIWLFRPDNLEAGEKRPAILCCHGHGPYGKNPVMGIAPMPEHAAEIKNHNYDYGRQMAKAGFVTYSLDWLGFGERAYAAKPHFYNGLWQRDPCNIMYLCATMLGTTVLAGNLHDAKTVTDFVCSQPFVDPRKLGVMGLSLGGTMTTWAALFDDRFLAADVICYHSTFWDIAFRTYNCCGSQITPGLFDLCDIADLQGLIAPRPLLMEIGIHDTCFQADFTLPPLEHLKGIYAAAGAPDRLEVDLFPGEHAWGGHKSVAFFRQHLSAEWPS